MSSSDAGAASDMDTPFTPLSTQYAQYKRQYQQYLDKITPFVLYRWLATAGLIAVFLLRIVLSQGVSSFVWMRLDSRCAHNTPSALAYSGILVSRCPSQISCTMHLNKHTILRISVCCAYHYPMSYRSHTSFGPQMHTQYTFSTCSSHFFNPSSTRLCRTTCSRMTLKAEARRPPRCHHSVTMSLGHL